MNIRLADLIAHFGGILVGNAQIIVNNIAPLDVATSSQITFLANKKFLLQAKSTKAAALILSHADHILLDNYQGACILTTNPYAYFAKVAQFFVQKIVKVPECGIHSSACIALNAHIAPSATIGPHVVIEANAFIDEKVVVDAGCFIGRSAHIGAYTHLHAHVTLHHECEIGQRSIVHSGAVIGTDGFGFAKENDVWIKIPQVGRVLIGNDVEIGSNTTIDRGTMKDTVLQDGVKIDNQIQIAHNCYIDSHTAVAACVGIAGSVTIGKFCFIGGAAMINDHVTIADRVYISAGTFVLKSIKQVGRYTGFYPISTHVDWEKSAALVRYLSNMRKKIQEMSKTIKLFKTYNNE